MSGNELNVSVKPLEWVEHGDRDFIWHRAMPPIGSRYNIEDDGFSEKKHHLTVGQLVIGNFDVLDEAKAAAQSDYEQRIMSAVEGHLSISELFEAAARAGDAAVYEAMRSKTFDPSIPDNVAEFVGNAIRAAVTITGLPNAGNAPQTPSCNHVNGGAYRGVSVEEWRDLGGDDNKVCDWHEGIGYVVYDEQAREQYRVKMEALTPTPAPTASPQPVTKPAPVQNVRVTGFRGNPLRVVLSSGDEATISQKLIDNFASPSPFEQHPDDVSVDRFAAAMKAKLAKKRADGAGGWDDPEVCHIDYLVSLLMQQTHERAVLDPVDIANLSMMIHERGETPSHGR
jgi:hypothetical protein